MPTPVIKPSSGTHGIKDNIKTVQAALSRPVVVRLDDQMRAAEIIKLQQYLVTQGKFSAGNVNKSIDDQMLGAKLKEVQDAANLP